MLVCDGLKGLPDAVTTVWEKTIVQTCIVHLLRNSFKYASKRDWAADRQRPQARLHRGVGGRCARPVRRVLREMGETLPGYHPAVGERVGGIRAIPGLRPGNKDRHLHDQCDRVDQRPAAAGRERPRHFPTEQAALKCLYLAIMSLDPTGKGRQRWTNRWKAALNAFDITFDGRLSAGGSNNQDQLTPLS
jgi:Transposase and inactivated derivatives